MHDIPKEILVHINFLIGSANPKVLKTMTKEEFEKVLYDELCFLDACPPEEELRVKVYLHEHIDELLAVALAEDA